MAGVLDGDYSQDRLVRPELIFRYKTRSLLVSRAIEKFLKGGSGRRLTDFGSAEGLSLLEMNRLLPPGWTFSGIEYSEDLVAKAPLLPPNVSIKSGDVTAPLPEAERGLCDAVSALAVLEHLDNPAAAVKNAYALLKPGGIFVATAPVPFWDNISTRLNLLKGGQHESEMSLSGIIGCMTEAGFEIVESGRFMWAPVSFLPYLGIRVSPPLALRIDEIVGKFRVMDFLFVNQYAIGRKNVSEIRMA